MYPDPATRWIPPNEYELPEVWGSKSSWWCLSSRPVSWTGGTSVSQSPEQVLSIFWKTQDIGLDSYSNNLSTVHPTSCNTCNTRKYYSISCAAKCQLFLQPVTSRKEHIQQSNSPLTVTVTALAEPMDAAVPPWATAATALTDPVLPPVPPILAAATALGRCYATI